MDGRRARTVLGVGSDAGPDEIRRAFRARALVTHPDHGGDCGAFAVLLDAVDTLDTLDTLDPPPTVASIRPPAALLGNPPRFDAYDSPRRGAPPRAFADALQAATARLG
jgi:curved DNA-binding protein CbpA